MARHYAEIDGNQKVIRVVLSDTQEWLEQNLGGTWVRTPNPNEAEPDDLPYNKYAGIGYLAHLALLEVFIPDPEEWNPAAQFIDAPNPATGRWKWQRSLSSEHMFCTYQGNLYRLNAPVDDVATSSDVPGVSSRWRLHELHISGWGLWSQPGGWGDEYPQDFIVAHDPDNGGVRYWKSDVATNVWEPGVSQWTEVDINGDPLPLSADWQAGVTYSVNDEVNYQGTQYRCLQAHASQVGWEPPNVPALWEVV